MNATTPPGRSPRPRSSPINRRDRRNQAVEAAEREQREAPKRRDEPQPGEHHADQHRPAPTRPPRFDTRLP
jgi:hypothetical protein